MYDKMDRKNADVASRFSAQLEFSQRSEKFLRIETDEVA
jgi:hypothetical protein